MNFIAPPPGEVHTLTVDSDDKILTFFHLMGPIMYLDPEADVIGYDDKFSMIRDASEHYDRSGLGAGYVTQFIR